MNLNAVIMAIIAQSPIIGQEIRKSQIYCSGYTIGTRNRHGNFRDNCERGLKAGKSSQTFIYDLRSSDRNLVPLPSFSFSLMVHALFSSLL